MLGYLSMTLQIRSDISFFLPQKSNQMDQMLRHQLTEGEAGKIILIALKTKNHSLEPDLLAQLNQRLHKKLQQNPDFSAVHNGQFDQTKVIIEPYYSYRYLLNPLNNPLANHRFSNTQLTQAFTRLSQQLQLVISPWQQQLFAADPLMVWLTQLQHWQPQRLDKHNGVWFDKSGQRTLLFVKTRAEGFDLTQQQHNVAFINDSISLSLQELKITQPVGEIDIILTGAAIFGLASKQAISQQSQRISLGASVLLILFLYAFFRSVKVVLLIALPLSLAILAGITSVILLDGFIHGITIAFGVTILGIAVDYPIHFYSHALVSTNNQSMSMNQTIKIIWPMLRLGLITTLLGFSAIVLSDFSGLRQLGLFAISGLLMAAMTTRWLLPILAIESLVNARQLTSIHHTIKKYQSYQLMIKSHLFWLLSLTIMLLCLSSLIIFFNYQQLWEKELSALSPVPSWKKQQDFELRQAMGLAELRYSLLVNSEELETLLQQSEQLMPQLNILQQQGVISAYDMAARYLPSMQYQQQQQQQLPSADSLQKQLMMVLNNSDLDYHAFQPFIEQVNRLKNAPLLSLQRIINNDSQASIDNPITSKIKTLIVHQNQNNSSSTASWTAIIPLQGVMTPIALIELANANDHVYLLDIKKQSEELLNRYRNEALVWFFYGLILILGVLWISCRQLSVLLILAIPVVSSVLLTIASLLLLGYSLSIFHLVTLLLVIGLAIDYSVFSFFSRSTQQQNQHTSSITQLALLICLGSTLLMFGALSLSDLPVLKAIGLTAALGAVYAFLLTFLIDTYLNH
jgi:predicted exporter